MQTKKHLSLYIFILKIAPLKRVILKTNEIFLESQSMLCIYSAHAESTVWYKIGRQ